MKGWLYVFLLFSLSAAGQRHVLDSKAKKHAGDVQEIVLEQKKEMERLAAEESFADAVSIAGHIASLYRKEGSVSQIIYHDSIASIYAKQSGDSLLILKTLTNYANDLIENARLLEASVVLNEAEKSFASFTTTYLRWYQIRGNLSYKKFQLADAILFYEKGLEQANAVDEPSQAMIFRWLIGSANLHRGKPDSMHLVFQALEYFEKNNQNNLAAQAANTIATSFRLSFNPDKAITYLQRAIDFAQADQDPNAVAVFGHMMGEIYLQQKKFTEAEKVFTASHRFFKSKGNLKGVGLSNVYLGRLFTETNRLEEAERCFAMADSVATVLKSDLLRIAVGGYRMMLLGKQKNFKAADSVGLAAFQATAKIIDKDLLKHGAQKFQEGNPELQVNVSELVSAYHINKAAKITTLGIDSSTYKQMENLNEYSGFSAENDTLLLHKTNQNLLRLETGYRTRAVTDSLQQEKQQFVLAKKEIKTRNQIVIGTGVLLVLVSVGLWLQYRNRKRAERDKARIELLQNEIHHRVKNNLAVINRLVEVSGKNILKQTSVSELKTRIKSIELVHRHLYNNGAETGRIHLQSYFSELCSAIAITFKESKTIHLEVNAPADADGRVAEKLGLIVNELVTNSYKYAFPHQPEGTIHLTVEQNGNDLHLTVKDDGIGLPPEIPNGSYGMKLIKGLSRELNGRFTFQNQNGTAFELFIPA